MSRYLITGAQGFFGGWIIKKLIDDEHVHSPSDILAIDLKPNDGIFRQILNKTSLSQLKREYFDVTDAKALNAALSTFRPHYVIHLAGLQIPTCRARPVLGGMVNVIGTLNVFECVKQYNDGQSASNRIKSVVYASSAGICGKKEDYLPSASVKDHDVHTPRTHYGVFKLCNEGNARIYFQDHGISSVGLRPLTVYGVGREVGLTSDATKAIKSAVLGLPFSMGYRGTTLFHYVEDVANAFIRCSNRCAVKPGAYACNLRGVTMDCHDFLGHLFRLIPGAEDYVDIDSDGVVLPFPDSMEQDTLDQLFKGRPPLNITSVPDAIGKIVAQFQALKKANRLHAKDLPSKL